MEKTRYFEALETSYARSSVEFLLESERREKEEQLGFGKYENYV